MKSKIVKSAGLVILLSMFISSCLYKRPQRNPITVIENVSNLDLKQFDCSVEFFKEDRYSDGQGSGTIILYIKNFPNDSDMYLKSKGLKLGTVANLDSMHLSFLASQEFRNYFIKLKESNYLYDLKSNSDSDFEFLIVDLDNHRIIYEWSAI